MTERERKVAKKAANVRRKWEKSRPHLIGDAPLALGELPICHKSTQKVSAKSRSEPKASTA